MNENARIFRWMGSTSGLSLRRGTAAGVDEVTSGLSLVVISLVGQAGTGRHSRLLALAADKIPRGLQALLTPCDRRS